MTETGTEPVVDGLTPAQARFFHRFGFVCIRDFLGARTQDVIAGFEKVMSEREQIVSFAEVHFEKRSRGVSPLLEHDPRLAPLERDPRLLAIARTLIGNDIEYRGSAGNFYDCDTSWHCDIYGSPLDQFHIKCLFYLDHLTADTGALRVIPGTQEYASQFARTLRRDLDPWTQIEEMFGVAPDQIPSFAIETHPGDLIVSNFRTIHATFGGAERRRLLTMNYRSPHRPS